MKRVSLVAAVAALALAGTLAMSGAAHADCSGHVSVGGFQFRCDRPLGSPEDPDTGMPGSGAHFNIALRTPRGQVLSGKVTSPSIGFTCEGFPSGTSRRGVFHTSSLDCSTGSEGSALPAGRTVTGTWRLSTSSACTPGANLDLSQGDAVEPVTPLPCTTNGGSNGGGSRGLALSSVSAVPRAFRLGSALLTATLAPPVGTTISFRLSGAARAALTFSQPKTGRRVRSRCRSLTRANRRNPRCTLPNVRGSLSVAAHAGTNRVRFQGRLSRSRRLRPGRYTLTIRATDSAGNRSGAGSTTFTIVPG
ncbi:MAG TPA: hypothetical protein VGN71_06965 [Solirubrobacteraceae bacterium]|nr:hypothetical protein [Solirubrobacteraceae bacterium]